ncbi:MAG: hypothetical protein DME57_02160 [Verrucomicrobia bacterium]|nr:MAG: hypothetical protein DME57_02160 [Verrucomicrobiota bacterium]
MKRFQSRCKLLVLLFAAAILITPVIADAGTGAEYSRDELMGNSGLSIFRAADFGNHQGLSIYIDGVALTTLARGEGYRAVLRPGHHLLTVTNTPSPYGKTKFTHRSLDLAAGQNYSLTAIWDVETITLEDGGYVYHGFYR